ncbi:MAG: heavy-metal-associated domain-containing protein [Pseudomonadota bacterium]|nr:heavy-metal-associated domain-containing protein [Pseudomonadota bacterium]
MITFEVNDMTCGHCVSTISKAVKATDTDAKVSIDLATHRVVIEPTKADSTQLSDAIKEAGYTPVAVANPAAPIAVGAAKRGGCCCG